MTFIVSLLQHIDTGVCICDGLLLQRIDTGVCICSGLLLQHIDTGVCICSGLSHHTLVWCVEGQLTEGTSRWTMVACFFFR